MGARATWITWLTGGLVAAVGAVLLGPATGLGHNERPSYWPDPAPETVGGIKVGGKVPKARPLGSALHESRRRKTQVVCKTNSMRLLRASLRRARKRGYDIRPTAHRRLSAKKARRLRRVNRRFFKRCEFNQIQQAVTASNNHDRVVIMPGVYLERRARKQPTFDPACDKYEVTGDPPNRTGAASYAYQVNCPNDQNLIAVIGRKLGTGTDPSPPRWNRHGIPNAGRCIRCNLQIEGSGVRAEDVVIEAGDKDAGNGGPSGAGSKKDVGVRADRADGFVLRKVTVRHALEHGIYVIETDGYLLDRFKAFYNGLYGTLTFVDDHGVQQNCETAGHGDSGVYPGAPVETGEQRPPGTAPRYNQEVRGCDSYHNLAGYSATNGNAVHVHHNNFYGNALGFNTDVATSPGHPGFPGDSMLIEHNNFYSNNYNLYEPEPPEEDVTAAFPYPVGTGIWIAGGNNHTIRRNHFWNNWRRGAMVFAVPNQLVCGPAAEGGNMQAGCDPLGQATSNRNRLHGNTMGITPSGKVRPNGTDFWWDQFLGNTANCWYQNEGSGPITSSPPAPLLPNCDNGRNPALSIGTGNLLNEAELAICALPFITGDLDPDGPCPWFDTPAKPRTQAARAQQREDRAQILAAREELCAELPASNACRGD